MMMRVGMRSWFVNVGETRIPVGSGLVVGRDEGCDIVVDDPEVSRQHCRVTELDGAGFVEDLQSANGTFVNGIRAKGVSRLRAGDLVQVGATALFVGVSSAPPPPLPARTRRTDAGSTPFRAPLQTLQQDESRFAPRVDVIEPEERRVGRAFRDAVRVGHTTALVLVGDLDDGDPPESSLAEIRAAVRANVRHAPSPDGVLRAANDALHEARSVASALCARIDSAAQRFDLSSAGRECGWILRRGATPTRIAFPPCVELGQVRAARFPEQSSALAAGDVAVLPSLAMAPRVRQVLEAGEWKASFATVDEVRAWLEAELLGGPSVSGVCVVCSCGG
jgi:hypothetical protein